MAGESGDGAAGGTYTLLIDLETDAEVTFGGAGPRPLPSGRYAYTGSALGPGGFARIDRHRSVASGERDVRHWHVDALLGHAETSLLEAVRSPGLAAECRIARAIADAADPVPGVGATDCDCGSHLAGGSTTGALAVVVRRAHRRARG